MSRSDVRKLDSARRRLIKRAKNQKRVTYKDVIDEAGLETRACQRVCADALRNLGVGFKAPRRKIYVSEEDAKQRLAFARAYSKKPACFWATSVHAYVDNKAFPMPLTAKPRERFQPTMLTWHLRKASKGTDRHSTAPRGKPRSSPCRP